jgi:hypothetical protein
VTRALQKLDDGDFEIFGVLDPLPEQTINIDEATDRVFGAFNWPLLGGPSGRGWSYFSTAQRCGQLFKKSYDVPPEKLVRKVNAQPLQIGALFHTLEALYYGHALGNAFVLPDRQGLVTERLALPGRRRRWSVPDGACDALLEALRTLKDGEREPDATVIDEAERLFDTHTNWWDNREDVQPLGVEVFAQHPKLGYTCRYDLVARVGTHDPELPEGVFIFEKKTAKWIDEKLLESWQLDGEVLGQILCWAPSGMEKLFGPLSGVVVDIVSKGRTADCRRVVVPPTAPAVAHHEKWIRWVAAEIEQWRAIDAYPQRFANCWTRYGRCEEFQNCTLGLTQELK